MAKGIESNRHHVFFNKRLFDAERTNKALREYESSIIRLPVQVHNNLHSELATMQVPKPFIARLALQHLMSLPESYNELDNISSAADFLHEVGEQMQPDAELVANHLDKQMPHLKLGHFALRRKHL